MEKEKFKEIQLNCERELNRTAAKACRLTRKAKETVETYFEVIDAYNAYLDAIGTKETDEKAYVEKCAELLKKIFFINQNDNHTTSDSLGITNDFIFKGEIDLNNLSYEDCVRILKISDFEKVIEAYDNNTSNNKQVNLHEYTLKLLNAKIDDANNTIIERKNDIAKYNNYPKFLSKIKFIKTRIDNKIARDKKSIYNKQIEIADLTDYILLITRSETALKELIDTTDPIPADEKMIKDCEKSYERIFKENLATRPEYQQAKEMRSREYKTAIIAKHFNDEVIAELSEDSEFLINLGRIDALNSVEKNKKKIKNFLIGKYIPEEANKKSERTK